ncbi:unnamed protein product [Arabis nemorensis]|uniref:TIR domain-containing protein n=1 Tax=Arabis nemorensis TaxID=586526 RepID=A0A565C2Y4_9BRAS|nr:unnamed protein product [Arabis nemorensis]
MDNNKNNQVFISFEVEDSSVSSFISYLIAAFKRQGIFAFFDSKSSHVEAGEREGEEERFSKLKVFVVVFSKNYASHIPCLEKQIYACRNNDDFVVVPVFYHVSKSSLKQHMRNFGDEFKAVQRAKPKLRGGHEYDGERSESDFQEEIARVVFEKLYPTEEIGTQSSILEIENLLCKQPWGVRTIEPSHRKKRVLVALDDVQKAQDAKSFLGGFDKFGPGSLIIITSKDKRTLQECKMNEIYELKGLNDEDALKLFTRCAFGKDVIEENLLDDSMKAIECCEGNPSALRSCAKVFKATVEKEPVLPDVCEVFITGQGVSCDTAKNTYMQFIPYEEDDEPQENKEFPSDHIAVLVTRDTKKIILSPSHLCAESEFHSYSEKNPRFAFYNRISKSLTSNLMLYRLDYNAVMRSFLEHLLQKHHVIVQGLGTQLPKFWQSLYSR